jgi:hypothetical protein
MGIYKSALVDSGGYCWKMGGAARNQPNECIKGVSEEQNKVS